MQHLCNILAADHSIHANETQSGTLTQADIAYQPQAQAVAPPKGAAHAPRLGAAFQPHQQLPAGNLFQPQAPAIQARVRSLDDITL